MTTRAEDNPFPSVLFAEHVDPSNPSAGTQRLFVDTDHLLKLRDSSGTVTTYGTGSFSDPMTSRGDIIIRNASNVTARLAKGSAGTFLSSDGTDVSWGTPTVTSVAAHAVRANRSSGDVSLGNNTYTIIGFNAEDYDTDTMHDNSTNPSRFTVPTITGVTTGLWAMLARGYTNATSGRSDMQFRKNAAGSNSGGTQIGATISGPISSSGVGTFNGWDSAVLSAGDYIEVFVRTTAGSFSAIFEAGDSPIFEMWFLGKVS